MNKKDAPIREEDLHAYVDGAIEGPRRAQIEDYLSRHPDVATRIQGHIALRERLREQLMPIVEDPIPPELNLARMVEAHRHRRRIPWRIAASVLLAVAVGGVVAVGVLVGTDAARGLSTRPELHTLLPLPSSQ